MSESGRGASLWFVDENTDATDGSDSQEVQVFDIHQVFADRVGAKTVVYFDQNAWINLRDGDAAGASECAEICHAGVAEGRVIFPVSYASATELLAISDDALRLRLLPLMSRAANCLVPFEPT